MNNVLATLMIFFTGVLGNVLAQTSAANGLQSVTLLSPFVHDGPRTVHVDEERGRLSCLNLKTLDQSRCHWTGTMDYGTRVGDNQDIFKIEIAQTEQTRVIDLGKHEWTDSFDVPYIRPWPRLRPGENRSVALNASGTRAPDGKTYAHTDLNNQVSSSVQGKAGLTRSDVYDPLTVAIEGHIYAIRVLDDKDDFYLLVRVEKVVQGNSATITFKKVPSPKAPVF